MQKYERLNGSLWLFKESIGNIDGSLISASIAANHQRKMIILKFDTIDFKGRLSKRKFNAVLEELKAEGIYLRVAKYPINKTELERLKNRLAKKYEKRTQFYIDQSIVVLAISYEEFLRRLFLKYYMDDPRRIGKNKELDIERSMTIGDLADKVDLPRLYSDIADSIVTRLLRGSASNWFDNFEKILKFSFDDARFEVSKNQIIELFYVRNSIVHNAKFITKDLVNHKNKFIGLHKVNPSTNDYIRYRKACKALVYDLVEQYNLKYSDRLASVDKVTDHLINLHNRDTGNKAKNVKLSISREELNSLVKSYKYSDLSHIRSLLTSNFYDSKLLALKVLIYQYKKPHEDGLKNKIFIFCLLNLDLFDDWEMLNLLARNILTGPRVAGHNIQLLQGMSAFNSPTRSYLLLRIIKTSPEIATKRHLAWILNNIQRNTIIHMKGQDRVRLTRLYKQVSIILQSN